MKLPRLQLWEVEDQPWWPLWLRDYQTDILEQIQRWFRVYDGSLPLLKRLQQQTGESAILDLCSGGGGPWPDWLRRGLMSGPVQLSDLYPNRRAFERLEQQFPGIQGRLESFDALELGSEPPGLRTLFTALHHLAPEDVRRLLSSVRGSGRPLAAFDFNHRSWLNLALVGPLAWLACWLMTPGLRPSWSRICWTYLLPVVPLALAWDGLVSQLRAYTPAEIGAMLPQQPGYRWEVGSYRCLGLLQVTYLLGWPEHPESGQEKA